MIKIKGLSDEEVNLVIPNKCILLGYTGSISHGTKIEKSNPDCIDDIDLLGVCVGEKSIYLGLDNFEQKIVKYNEFDSVVYEIRKFFRLLLKQNPNVLGLLWLQDKDYIYKSLLGQQILNNRNLFVSKKAYHSFTGFAISQRHRMTHFPDVKAAYMGKKRYELVKKFGYDPKNLQHTIRTLRMGIEFLTDGHLQVFRPDNDELKSIKRGEWSLDKGNEEIDRLLKLIREAYVKSSLPNEPNYKKANELLIDIIEENLKET